MNGAMGSSAYACFPPNMIVLYGVAPSETSPWPASADPAPLIPPGAFPVQADPVASLVRGLEQAVERAQKAEIECTRLRGQLAAEPATPWRKGRKTEPDMLFDLSPEEPADIEPPSPHDTMQSLRHYCEVNPRNPQTCSRGVEHCRVEHPPCSRCTELEAEVELLEARIDADGDAMAHEITRRAVLEALVRELYQTMEHSGCDLRLVARSRELVPDTHVCPGCTISDPALCLDCARDARVR